MHAVAAPHSQPVEMASAPSAVPTIPHPVVSATTIALAVFVQGWLAEEDAAAQAPEHVAAAPHLQPVGWAAAPPAMHSAHYPCLSASTVAMLVLAAAALEIVDEQGWLAGIDALHEVDADLAVPTLEPPPAGFLAPVSHVPETAASIAYPDLAEILG